MDFKLQAMGLSLYYGCFQALKDVNVSIRPRAITAIIGPSGCGKSTLLRCFNRMNELIKGVRVSGRILLDGADIYDSAISLTQLRRQVGLVFQRPNPFPLSVFNNVAYGVRVHGAPDKARLEAAVEASLRATWL